jgi:hypothetical protein
MEKDGKAHCKTPTGSNWSISLLPSLRFSWRKLVISIFLGIIMFATKRVVYPSYEPHYQGTLSPEMREVSSLLGDLYELLVDMTYLDRLSKPIDYPPHNPPRNINTTLATQLGIHHLAVQLLETFPYFSGYKTSWAHGAGDLEFLLYGAFADFRDDGFLEESRDPLYAGVDPLDKSVGWDDEYGQYMYPWHIALNRLGNHGVVLILNLKNNHLWVIDQESGCADPALRDVEIKPTWNKNSLEQYPSRPARDVLKDFMKLFRNLDWIPGGLVYGTHEYEHYKRLYLENGWPDQFDATAFNSSRIAWEEAEEAQYSAEEPFREVKKFESWLRGGQRCDVRCRIQQMEADNSRPEWHGQFADPNGGKIMYESRKKELEEELAAEPERTAELEKQLKEAKARVLKVPEDVRRSRVERLQKYG